MGRWDNPEDDHTSIAAGFAERDAEFGEQIQFSKDICGRCGERPEELHHFHLDGGNSFFCLACCQEEERAWHEDNGQFGVGA
jgi:hypothetical protein